MPHLSEIQSKRKFRPRLKDVIDSLDFDGVEFARDLESFIDTAAHANDYTGRHPIAVLRILSVAEEFDYFYDNVFRRMVPDAPARPWDVAEPEALTIIIEHYLTIKILNTKGQHHSGRVRAGTLHQWGNAIMFVAAFNILGYEGHINRRPPWIMKGRLVSKADSQYVAIMERYVPTAIGRFNLPQLQTEKKFWGPNELSLVVHGCDARIMEVSIRASALVQLKAATQLGLTTGIRSGGIASPGRHGAPTHYLAENRLLFTQYSPGEFTLDVDYVWLKGLNKVTMPETHYTPRIPPMRRLANIQLEPQCSILPLLISRGVLFYDTPEGRVFVKDIDHLERCTAMHLRVVSTLPLCRKVDVAGDVFDKPLDATQLNVTHREMAKILRLRLARFHSYRRYHGSIALATSGEQGQQKHLMHHPGVGVTTYSHGAGDTAMSSIILDEFGPEDSESKIKLAASRIKRRERDGDAVQAMIDIQRKGLCRQFSGTSLTADEREHLKSDPVYQTLITEAERQKQMFSDTVINPPAERAYKEAKTRASVRMHKLVTDASRRLSRAQSALNASKFDGATIAEFESAYQAVTRLRNSVPLPLTSTTLDATWNLSQLWPTTPPVVEQTHVTDLYCPPETDEDGTGEELQPNESDIYDDGGPTAARSSHFEDIPGNNVLAMNSRARKNQEAFFASERAEEQHSRFLDNEGEMAPEDSDDMDGEFIQPESAWAESNDDGSFDPREDVIRARFAYMRFNYNALRSRDSRNLLDDFVTKNGWCPFCHLHVLGTHGLVNTSDGNRGFARWPVGVFNGKAAHSIHKHMRASHPHEWDQISRGITPPALGDASLKTNLPGSIEFKMAKLLSGALTDTELSESPYDDEAAAFLRDAFSL